MYANIITDCGTRVRWRVNHSHVKDKFHRIFFAFVDLTTIYDHFMAFHGEVQAVGESYVYSL